MSENLSKKQEEILNFLKKRVLEYGYPPTVREIGKAVNLKSTSSVHAHLAALTEKGYIRKNPAQPRTIEIVDEEFNIARRDIKSIPLIGQVAAGQPIFAEQNITTYFPFASSELPNGNLFMLEVRGESMINIGIHDGDKIIVQETNVAKNGDVIVALVEDSATVKTYYKEKDHYRLQPENDTMDPIIVDEVNILGRCVGLFRLL